MNNYNFPVELQPIYLPNGAEIPKRKAVVRTDTNTSLGLVSDDYALVNHTTVVDGFREVGQRYGATEKITLAKDGAFLFYEMKFPKITMEAKKGDLVQMMMVAKNSYNGMNSLQIVFGAFRLVCLNGMVLGTKFMQFSYRHVGSVGGLTPEAIIEQYVNAYDGYVDLFNRKGEVINQMARQQVIAGDSAFDPKQVELPGYLLNEAKQSFDKEADHTVWGYYNSLTYAVTHKMRKPNPDLQLRYGMHAWKIAEQAMN